MIWMQQWAGCAVRRFLSHDSCLARSIRAMIMSLRRASTLSANIGNKLMKSYWNHRYLNFCFFLFIWCGRNNFSLVPVLLHSMQCVNRVWSIWLSLSVRLYGSCPRKDCLRRHWVLRVCLTCYQICESI